MISSSVSSFSSGINEGEKLLLWRGEETEGYSMTLRHVEFINALQAVLLSHNYTVNQDTILFTDALVRLDCKNGIEELMFTINMDGKDSRSDYHLQAFEGAMQYVHLYTSNIDSHTNRTIPIPRSWIIDASKRCSLVRSCYEIVAMGDTYAELAQDALHHHLLDDMKLGNTSWSVRMRQFGTSAVEPSKAKRYGKRVKSSLSLERQAIEEMYDLLIQFQGPVQLKNPDCALYIFEGIAASSSCSHGSKILARKLMDGPETSSLSPKTRICKTNTPLCPVAAHIMCNVAQIRPGHTVLDVYAGSCSILLVATRLASMNPQMHRNIPSIQTVGIDIAHGGCVNRDDILQDFVQRDLMLPVKLIQGDSSLFHVRQDARNAIGGEPFDCIVTDPPYGIREAVQSSTTVESELNISPLIQLVTWIAQDRKHGKPLLKKGGRLVAFVPVLGDCTEEEMRDSVHMPHSQLLQQAGLNLCLVKEQSLNDVLSRWLVAYECIE
jgi:tRNA G10  N-methylase Trm11